MPSTESKLLTSVAASSTTTFVTDLNENKAKLDALAKEAYKKDFLQNGGSGVNGLTVAWDSLPATEQEAYRKQILEGAL